MSDSRPSPKRRCFVVMGFGVKTDLATGRKLDLDKAYRALIKPVVESKGLTCIRADEIRHTGTIDVPMYEQLLTADVVVADISTANPNAIYELGIRHALRPRTTVVISENKLPYPFDLNHILISSYTHLGDVIDFDEVVRFRQVLGDTLESVLNEERPDSPVYTYLKLTPPALAREAADAVARADEALQQAGAAIAQIADDRAGEPDEAQERTLATLVEQGERAIRESRFADARTMFAAALHMCNTPSPMTLCPRSSPHFHDPYLLQRLVLSTYKEEQATPEKAVAVLQEAKAILEGALCLEDSNDPETIGLGGAVEKRLYDLGAGDLTKAIGYYARGYFLRQDRYNGINLAALLTIRSDTPLSASAQEKIADLVWASRIRREVLELCGRELQAIAGREGRTGSRIEELPAELTERDGEEKFWCYATMAEAHFGLGQGDDYARDVAALARLAPPAAWTNDTLRAQIARLNQVLQKQGGLLDPPWPGETMSRRVDW